MTSIKKYWAKIPSWGYLINESGESEEAFPLSVLLETLPRDQKTCEWHVIQLFCMVLTNKGVNETDGQWGYMS